MKLLSLVLASLAMGQDKDVALDITNVVPGEELRHGNLILNGSSPEAEVSIALNGKPAVKVPCFENRFWHTIALTKGRNEIYLRAGSKQTKCYVTFRPSNNERIVQPLLVLSADADEKNPKIAAQITKIQTAVRLMQAFCSESLRSAGLGRRSFRYESDADGNPVVKLFKLSQPKDALLKKDGNALYNQVWSEYAGHQDQSRVKVLALMSFTTYDTATKTVAGHTALGGGNLALFGTGTANYWPSSLNDVPSCFLNSGIVSREAFFDDSGNRGTVWANAATALGAMMHELGHAFGLPHTTDGRCIMSRGFDQINRAFWPFEASTPATPSRLTKPGEEAYWSPFFAARLAEHPWFQSESLFAPSGTPAVKIERQGDRVILRSAPGIRIFGYYEEGKPSKFEHVRGPNMPVEIVLSLGTMKKEIDSESVRVYAMDKYGQESQSEPLR